MNYYRASHVYQKLLAVHNFLWHLKNFVGKAVCKFGQGTLALPNIPLLMVLIVSAKVFIWFWCHESLLILCSHVSAVLSRLPLHEVHIHRLCLVLLWDKFTNFVICLMTDDPQTFIFENVYQQLCIYMIGILRNINTET